MTKMFTFILLTFGVLLSVHTETLAAKKAPSKKVLFLAGGPSHGPGKHEHNAGCLILSKALNESGLGFSSSVVSKWPEDVSSFDDVDAVVVFADAGGKYKEEQLQVLDKRIKAGMGIMFIHYGVHPSKEVGQKYFTPWIGGYFETGWSVNPHWTANLKPKKKHPVGRGVKKSVLVNDEFYYNMRYPTKEECSDCYPLVTSPLTPERLTHYNNLWNKPGDDLFGKDVTLMWCRDTENQGRGVGFTGGHFHHNWAIDGFRTLALNAIVWIAGSEVPKKGVKSAPISDEQLNKNIDGELKKPLTQPTTKMINSMPPMLRPEKPEAYNQRAHYDLIKKMKAEAETK